MAFDGSDKGSLKVVPRYVSGDPGFSESPQYRTDILVLEFYRSSSAADCLLKAPVMLCLAVGTASHLMLQHPEVVGDDVIVFSICPGLHADQAITPRK